MRKNWSQEMGWDVNKQLINSHRWELLFVSPGWDFERYYVKAGHHSTTVC